MLGKGYWVHGSKIIEVTGDRHILTVISNPELFGTTLKEIKKIYAKHKETLTQEGNAREDVVKMVSRDGWIRVRHYVTNPDYWSIQFDRWLLRRKAVRKFVEWAVLDKKIMPKLSEVAFLGFDDDYYETYTYINGGVWEFLKEGKKDLLKKKKLRDIFEFISESEFKKRYS